MFIARVIKRSRLIEHLIVLIPLIALSIGAALGAIWLAAEPICLKCLSPDVHVEAIELHTFKIAKYKCNACDFEWEPLITHRVTRFGCISEMFDERKLLLGESKNRVARL